MNKHIKRCIILYKGELTVYNKTHMSNKNNMAKLIVVIIYSLLLSWALVLSTDYIRTTRNFQKPKFALMKIYKEELGAGKYICLGYTVEYRGDSTPKDDIFDSKCTTFKLFGREIKTVLRN